MKFVSLHHHSTYSFQDGHGTPAQHFARAAALGMTSLAMTEHGNVSSHVAAEKAGLKVGVKPIFGLEAYTALDPKSSKKCHLTILAMNQVGYQNLLRITTESWQDFYRWPTVNGGMIAEHSEGLIVLSGCSDSLLACYLLGGKMIPEAEASYSRARKLAESFQLLLGDRFYLECQIFPELPRSIEINTAYERMGRELGIPLVATADVHTVQPGDHEIRALLHASGRGTNTIAQQLSSWEYEVPDYIPESDRQVFDRALKAGLSAKGAREACAMTAEIADRCNVALPKAERFRFNGTEADLKW